MLNVQYPMKYKKITRKQTCVKKLPKGLLNPIAFSARFFWRTAYRRSPIRIRTKRVQPVVIPTIVPTPTEAPSWPNVTYHNNKS